MSNYAAARFHMVEGQIRPNKIVDGALVAALRAVPRELFVPKAARGVAYVDSDVAVAPGRWLMEPLTLARLIQAAMVIPEDVVLDVGCATGYSTAILARLASTVIGIESDKVLADRATEVLRSLSVDNAVIMPLPLSEGYAAQAPYDVIVLEAAVAEVPESLLAQLADGGRLVAVVTGECAMGEGRLYQRLSGVVSSRALFETTLPLLPGFAPKPYFVF